MQNIHCTGVVFDSVWWEESSLSFFIEISQSLVNNKDIVTIRFIETRRKTALSKKIVVPFAYPSSYLTPKPYLRLGKSDVGYLMWGITGSSGTLENSSFIF
jgi:hypothetical protein